jgi:hypothetical protein
MARTRKFSYQNRKLEITASIEATGWAVRLFFDDGRRASQLTYSVSIEARRATDRVEMEGVPGDFVEHLMVLLQNDVESGRLQLIYNPN